MKAVMRTKALFVRVDANVRIGTGHLMRCLALGQVWKERGGRVIFVTSLDSGALQTHLVKEGFDVVRLKKAYPDPDELDCTLQVLAEYPQAWVVLDGYHFDTAYQCRIKEEGHPLLVIDDMAHLDHYLADIVLNQNVHAEGLRYSREPYTRLLLGTKYVLLRREFSKWHGWRRNVPEVGRKVLVTFGGADSGNMTLKAICALQQVGMEGMESVVIVGGANPHLEELRSAVRRVGIPIRLESNVADMSEWMAWADVAIAGSGTTCWELAYMGVPTLCVILADNQRSIAEELDSRGVVVNLGWYGDVSVHGMAQALKRLLAEPESRAELSRRGRRLVDGEGASRVLMHLFNEEIRFRLVRPDDCELLWKWANEPQVRAASFSSNPIPWEEHVRWFESKLSDPACFFLIALDCRDVPIGQVRFDLLPGKKDAVISISIAKEMRGRGYGNKVIRLASAELFGRFTWVESIHAYVKQGNEASLSAFAKAGYERVGTTEVGGQRAVHLLLGRKKERGG